MVLNRIIQYYACLCCGQSCMCPNVDSSEESIDDLEFGISLDLTTEILGSESSRCRESFMEVQLTPV